MSNPLLPEALETMKKWGFKYKTMITWHKERFNQHFGLNFKRKIPPTYKFSIYFLTSSYDNPMTPYSVIIEPSSKS